MNEYDGIVQGVQQDKTAMAARVGFASAIDTNPDSYAEAQRVARRNGVPVDTAFNLPNEIRRQDAMGSVDFEDLARYSPAASAVLADMQKAKIAHDDVDNLSLTERLLNRLQSMDAKSRADFDHFASNGLLLDTELGSNIRRAASSGLRGASGGAVGLARAPFELAAPALDPMVGRILPENPFRRTAAWLSSYQNKISSTAKTEMPKTEGISEAGFYSGVASAARNLAAFPMAFMPGGQSAALGAMVAPVFGESYGDAREKGLSPTSSATFGASQAAIEYATEKLPVSWLIKDLKAGSSFYKTLVHQGIAEIPGEQVATLLQDLNEWAALNPEKPFSDYLNERPSAAAQTLIATVVGTGGQVSVVKGIESAVNHGDRSKHKAQQAEQSADVISQLDQAAAASKVRGRDLDTFEQFIRHATENGPVQDVYISANALMQSGIAEKVATVSPAVAEQLQVALETGGDIRIPLTEYTSRIAGTDLSKPLLDHLKTDPDGFSKVEASDFMANYHDDLQKEVERTLSDKQNDDAFRASHDTVKQQVLDQLNQIDRFSSEKNEIDATLIAARTSVRAAQLGVTPEAMFHKQLLRVQAENAAGMQQYRQPVTGEFSWEFGQRDGLFGLAPIAVTQLRGDELGTDRPTIKAAAIAKLKTVGKEGLRNADTGWSLTLGKKDRSKLVKWDGQTDAGLQSIGGIESLVKNAVLAESHPDNHHSNVDVQGVHRLFAPVEIAGQMYRAKLTVKDYSGSGSGLATKLHALDSIEIESAQNRSPSPDDKHLETGKIMRRSERTLSIADLLADSTMSDGRSWDMYYQGAKSNRGAFSPDTNTIALLKNADLSTFLHESAHFFFENDIALASELLASQREGASLTEGEQQIISDMSSLLKWHGVQGPIDVQIAQWHTMGFEEKRTYHERTAESFEVYLLEGKAPSIELGRVFQTFRAWLLSVYKSIKSFVDTHPESGKLNDEVRGVFDRMLATTEQIKLAEQGRSMMPLFESAMQAGMTLEEFAHYHTLGVEATQEAIQELQARGLRDMQWLNNKRGREIKKLQKQARALRNEVQIDARREVMSQPIYQAWQFLTGKVRAESNTSAEKRKSDPNVLDETQDSLFVAIAKLGGLSKEEVIGQWGTDPADKPASAVFGKPVWRVDGGNSIDAMLELLSQHGYLPLDEHGKADVRDFEERFSAELRGDRVYSSSYDYVSNQESQGDINLFGSGRLDAGMVAGMELPDAALQRIRDLRMLAKQGGLHPDFVSDHFGFSSGDEMLRKLAGAEKPNDAIDALTDAKMLERYGDLSTLEAIERAADKAIHNEARMRFVATEANALAKATGQRKILADAAREFAANLIARTKVRDIRPGLYANAEARAARASDQAIKAGDLPAAAAEKRNQLIQGYAAKASHDAREEVDSSLRYLKKFDRDSVRKNLDFDYVGQIDALLERFDLRQQSNKDVDRKASLAKWIESQREQGIEPDIPEALENEAYRTSYKNLTVEELRGLVESVKQIEHLGRLKNQLLTAKAQRDYQAVRNEIVESITDHAGDRSADTRTPTASLGIVARGMKRFWASHIKAATWARVMDGGKDGGPMWEYFVRTANERGDMETTMRADATAKLHEILEPVFKLGKMGGKGEYFATIGRSLNRQERIAIALNVGNEGNLQRLLGGEGWNIHQIEPVLQSLTADEWRAVQAVWDHFESYRPQIADKETRVYGKEPNWVKPTPFTMQTADGKSVELSGGYYPIKYDPAASIRAEEHTDAEDAKRQMQGAYTSATTRRSFVKARTTEVSGRPLLYSLAGVYSGVNDVIHDLAWHEWLIDVNKLMKSKSIDTAIRDHYGPEAKQQLKGWIQDIANGDTGATNAGEMALGRLRQGVSISGLGFNVVSAIMQPLGITQSMVRVGPVWVGRGVAQYLANPLVATREVNEKSDFMANRSRTRFRELNELRNRVQDQSATKEIIGRYAYFLMMRCQQIVDTPTWLGAYEKAVSEGNDENRAIALADQAVIDSQGGGETKDLSAIERGGPALKLFTVFYSFMNTALNIGVAQTMSADTPAKRAKLAADYLLLYIVPPLLGFALKEAITPGGKDEDWDKLMRKLIAEQMSYLMGLMVVVREFSEASKIVSGADGARDYQGPAGLRMVVDSLKFGKQATQGEFDDSFRKSAINLIGDAFGLPSAQINRTVTGIQALSEGQTNNPAAVVFGFKKQ